MKLKDVWNKNVNVDELPAELHKELTVKKLANEMVKLATIMDMLLDSNDLAEIKNELNKQKMHITYLISSMIHLFPEWFDIGDLIYKQYFTKLVEEYALRLDTDLELDLDKLEERGREYKESVYELDSFIVDDDM